MRRFALSITAMLLFILLAVPGCGESGTSGDTATGASSEAGDSTVKLGFVVKQPEEPWFQLEWKFAQQAADEKGFDLVKIGATDGEKALAAIDNLAAQGAQGLVICTPDVRLGPAIAAKAKNAGLKLVSVDDQFLGPGGEPMADVHHLGISARNIGRLVGASLYEQMQARGWTPEDTAVCVVTFDELDTARERTDGATAALAEAGFPSDRIYQTPQKTSDVPGAFDAANILLTQHAGVKNWLICGMNDSAVMGAVRAMEGRGIGPDRALGIGINGTDGIVEFEKAQPTAFWGSILLAPRRHGYDTAVMMYEWVKDGKEPPKVTYTDGILITRETYKDIMREQGLL